MYIELHSASAFSFLDGASTPEALVDRAAELGYPALGLIDRDGVYGAPRFHQAAKAAGITPIIGSELTIRADGSNSRQSPVASRQSSVISRQSSVRVGWGAAHLAAAGARRVAGGVSQSLPTRHPDEAGGVEG